MVSSLHVISKNIGDMECVPRLYFDYGKHECDIRKLKNLHTDVIVGGGGLLSPFCKKSLIKLTELKRKKKIKKLIVWGVGNNTHYGVKQNRNYIMEFLNACNFVGIRDWNTKYAWVPCVSCMSNLFDIDYEITNDVVIYQHKDVPIVIDGYPKMNNMNLNLAEVIKFLGSSKTVITNSYHGVYWSTLLGKNVLSIPFSTRFNNFRHPPTVCNIDNWQDKIKDTKSYPDALQECRYATNEFHMRIQI